ncbi:H-type lectin domain-containing protein [Roseimicrobium sp. ORNL1]|uniref:H-type lectin domain-containing protein n=1 Tax=Roseimicrobium sp. ORNL1 TaxID=2711231 RepID=UPI0013E1D7B8|nr:H-type lectin domain-containing protein [Roseimicrobium sp. ORNL1]QIF03116.1 hypothetical protein G5S37_16840 [Roseimicrobium sp. ORNL1]
MQSSPWKVLSSHVSAGVLTEGWQLNTIEDADGDAPRICTFEVPVTFDAPFYAPPVVQLGLTGFDIDQRDSARLTLKAESITSAGFVATITTWAGTRVYGAEFQWLAIGA